MDLTELSKQIREQFAQNVMPLTVLVIMLAVAAVVIWRRLPETESTGMLRVETVPAGADVSLDGSFRGQSPLEIPDAAYGEHILRVEKAGFEPSTRAVTVGRDEVTVSANLSEKVAPAELSVTSEPSGASVRIGGAAAGWTPVVLKDLPPGVHQLVIRKEGYEAHRQSITLEAGRSAVIRAALQSKTAKVLKGRAEETGASVRDCVELAHHHILANDFDRAAAPLARALEMVAENGEERRWVMEEIEKPYWERYTYGDEEAVEDCRRMLEGVLISELQVRPSHELARDLLVGLLRKAGHWDRLAEAMCVGAVPIEDATPRELGLYGVAMVRAGRSDEVADTLMRSYRRHRDCSELTFALALVFKQNGEETKARIKLKQALLHCQNPQTRARIQTTLTEL
jgi:hypothetical protein